MPRFRLGDVEHDLTTRTLVMGILNRTPDSFYDHGSTFALDALVQRAEELVRDFRDAGLSHLLAVSGANVAFVLAIVGPLLRRLRLGSRLVGGLLGPGPARVLQLPTFALLRFVETVARIAASQPLAIDGRDLFGLVAVGCVGAVLLRVRRARSGRLDRDAAVPPG